MSNKVLFLKENVAGRLDERTVLGSTKKKVQVRPARKWERPDTYVVLATKQFTTTISGTEITFKKGEMAGYFDNPLGASDCVDSLMAFSDRTSALEITQYVRTERAGGNSE